MNKLKLFICAFGLAISGMAAAALDPVDNVLELELRDLNLPAHEADRVVIKQCENCADQQLKVNAGTKYRVGGFDAPALSLQAFKAAVRQVKDKSEVLVYVGYDPRTNTATRIVVSGGAK